jgi:hypothetical protein
MVCSRHQVCGLAPTLSALTLRGVPSFSAVFYQPGTTASETDSLSNIESLAFTVAGNAVVNIDLTTMTLQIL